jgi:8-oxo-dGTP pyrophosphatase MutT (NUDIX family)
LIANSRTYIDLLIPKFHHEEPRNRFGSDIAAVAIIFRYFNDEINLLLIKRVEREGDPWSGQIAFPGGRVEEKDANFRETAIRETREEVGFDLDKCSRFLGYLGSFKARTQGMVVIPSVFLSTRNVSISPNHEISSYRWIPLRSFLEDARRSIHSIEREGIKITFPSFVYNDYVIWGLTERIISTLISYL